MSSVATNQGLRQAQLFDSPSSSSSGQYTLAPVGDLKKTINVETKKRLMRKLLYPRLASKMEKAGFKYELTTEEQSLTMLYESATTIKSRIQTVVRQMHKGKQYLIWYEVCEGFDASGVSVIGSGSVVQHGLDKDVDIIPLKNSEGVTTKLQLGNVYSDVYTEEFTKEKIEQLLQNNELDERIQFSFCDNFGKSYGGFSAEEMIHCSAKELQVRGQLGKANEDLSVEYSSLSSKDKLFLQSQVTK